MSQPGASRRDKDRYSGRPVQSPMGPTRHLPRQAAVWLGAVSLALVAIAAQAQLLEVPPATITPLLPPAPAVSEVVPDGPITAPGRAERLKRHPLHGEHFWVRQVAGDPEATKVVVVVPQFHRSSTHPIAWSSLGQAIAEVQAHIESLMTTLLLTEGGRCVGTEGSAAPVIPGSHELKRLAWWRQDLAAAEARVREVLAGEGREMDDELAALRLVMDAALKERAAILDGVGALQARLDEGHVVVHEAGGNVTDRFGLEDRRLNAKAVALVRERDALYRRLALLETESVGEVQSALGQMWVDEYPLYREATITPLMGGLRTLDAEQKALRAQGADWPAQVLVRYTSLLRRIADDVIKVDDVEGTYAYYKEVADRAADGGSASSSGASPRKKRRLSRAQKRKKKRLARKLAKLDKRYEKITHAGRDRVAARRVLERVNAPEHDLCSLVFGQGHTDGLVAALLKEAKQDGLGPIGVIVVEPFDL